MDTNNGNIKQKGIKLGDEDRRIINQAAELYGLRFTPALRRILREWVNLQQFIQDRDYLLSPDEPIK